jgi:hypothetical protein
MKRAWPSVASDSLQSAHEFSVQLLINSARDILVDGLSEFEVRCVYHLKDVTVKLPSVAGGLKIS